MRIQRLRSRATAVRNRKCFPKSRSSRQPCIVLTYFYWWSFLWFGIGIWPGCSRLWSQRPDQWVKSLYNFSVKLQIGTQALKLGRKCQVRFQRPLLSNEDSCGSGRPVSMWKQSKSSWRHFEQRWGPWRRLCLHPSSGQSCQLSNSTEGRRSQWSRSARSPMRNPSCSSLSNLLRPAWPRCHWRGRRSKHRRPKNIISGILWSFPRRRLWIKLLLW